MQIYYFNFAFIITLATCFKWSHFTNSQEVIYVPRTNVFARWPFLDSFYNILRVVRPNVHVDQKSDYRSDFDENYVNYHAAQLWKILFKRENSTSNTNRTENLQKFIEKYVTLLGQTQPLRCWSVHRVDNNDPWVLVRAASGGLSTIPFLVEDLYDNTIESLQWLVPTDIRRYNVFSPDSTFQINRRYRYDPSVVRYYGYQLWKIHENDVTNKEMNQFWSLFGNEIWNINQDGIDILIDSKNTAKAKEFMAKSNFTYNIMIDDLEVAIDETYAEVNNTRNNMPWLEREGTLMNWNRYHDLGDIRQFMQYTLENYAEISEIIQIGLTNNKRPLEVLRISNGNTDNWAVFIDAGLQGRDWLSSAAVTLAISKLTYLWNSPLSVEMRNIDWYFLSVANPDGYQYSRLTDRLWTKNRNFDANTSCFGVNLDRNFEYKWGGAGSTANPCKNLYKGVSRFSEPETKAMKNFLLNMRDYLGAYISFGGYGQEIAYPWGDADFVTNNQRKLHQLGRKAKASFRKLNQAEYRVGSSYRLKLARAGNSADWVQYHISPQYVYNVFLKDMGRYGYLMPPHYIVETGEEVYEFMKVTALALDDNY